MHADTTFEAEEPSSHIGERAAVRVTIPQHVVYRRLPTETVVFNLRTGKYHGLNDTAGSMLEALAQATSIREAASSVATEYAQSQELIEKDMRELCDGLLARGLIELDGDAPD